MVEICSAKLKVCGQASSGDLHIVSGRPWLSDSDWLTSICLIYLRQPASCRLFFLNGSYLIS